MYVYVGLYLYSTVHILCSRRRPREEYDDEEICNGLRGHVFCHTVSYCIFGDALSVFYTVCTVQYMEIPWPAILWRLRLRFD